MKKEGCIQRYKLQSSMFHTCFHLFIFFRYLYLSIYFVNTLPTFTRFIWNHISILFKRGLLQFSIDGVKKKRCKYREVKSSTVQVLIVGFWVIKILETRQQIQRSKRFLFHGFFNENCWKLSVTRIIHYKGVVTGSSLKNTSKNSLIGKKAPIQVKYIFSDVIIG